MRNDIFNDKWLKLMMIGIFDLDLDFSLVYNVKVNM